MLKGTTSTGFKFKLDESVLNDYELLELIAEVEDNPAIITKIVKKVLGKETEKLKDHVRDENGRVSTERMNEEITEIFKVTKALKK